MANGKESISLGVAGSGEVRHTLQVGRVPLPSD